MFALALHRVGLRCRSCRFSSLRFGVWLRCVVVAQYVGACSSADTSADASENFVEDPSGSESAPSPGNESPSATAETDAAYEADVVSDSDGQTPAESEDAGGMACAECDGDVRRCPGGTGPTAVCGFTIDECCDDEGRLWRCYCGTEACGGWSVSCPE
jgi:hypothetical protein